MSTALTKVQTADGRHPMLRQLDLVMSGQAKSDDESLDASFLSRSFCLSGLPLRKQFERDKTTKKAAEPPRESTVFIRNDERFSLTIGTNPFGLPGGQQLFVGLPYGARARLLILWMTTQARCPGRASGDRWLEIGRLDSWLEQVGIIPHPESIQSAKDQMIRLAFASFTMLMRKEGLDYFRSDRLTESAVFAEEDLMHYASGNLSKVRFPLGLELSQKAYQRFTGHDVIPVSTEALRKISNNAMAIDILVYLSFRLPLIEKGESELLTWRKLATQFGSGETKSRFRQVFDASIVKALDAYTGANVDITDEGLILKYSPVDVRKLFAVSSGKPKDGGPLQRVRSRNRVVMLRDVSEQDTGSRE